jgi:hypothetical protein
VTHRHTGRADLPLIQHSEQQARQTGAPLRRMKFSQVLVSRSCRNGGFIYLTTTTTIEASQRAQSVRRRTDTPAPMKCSHRA